ncbi:hypothetical protein SAMN05216298_3372 [Glycomyces sambucus]|uniref:Uncharacterized protein n=1 Tax=Glycomyces sambucus TaxID=380244 RepID=A0A1G9J2K1_9ACTN|nr:hypothetical protein [Glycomyces sambucus]SDL31555.1 hypothetical protein SAMN05216298_3372 [Glycomyces sambucus]
MIMRLAQSLGYEVVTVEDGDGVLAVGGHDGASSLRVGWRPLIVEGYTGSGSIDRFAIRTRDARHRESLRDMRDRLRFPDRWDDPVELAGPILRLLESGAYGVRRWPDANVHIEPFGENRSAWWYPYEAIGTEGTAVIPTDNWPPPNVAMVDLYADAIRRGERPLAVLLRSEPPGDEQDCAAFLIDGHHKLAAYRRTGTDPHFLDIARLADRRPCEPADLHAVIGGDGKLAQSAANLMRYLEHAGQ